MFVIHSLTSVGGAERILSLLANSLSHKGQDVLIAVFDKESENPFYQISSEITIIPLNIKKASRILDAVHMIMGCLRIRNAVKQYKPDLLISFLTYENILSLSAALGLKIPLVVSERNDPRRSTKSRVLSWLRRKLYPNARYVICQTQDMVQLFNPPLDNAMVIPNPVLVPEKQEKTSEIPLPQENILFAVGGMTKEKIHQKGFDILFDVFSQTVETYPNWTLVILGDGPERRQLELKVQNMGMHGKILLPGNVKDIHTVLSLGDLFVLSSRYEGFPNALCEAMVCGLPVVSFDCPTGPRDIIRDDVDGLLVESENSVALKHAIESFMKDEKKRRKFGKHAEEIAQRFNESTVIKKWYDCISEITGICVFDISDKALGE